MEELQQMCSDPGTRTGHTLLDCDYGVLINPSKCQFGTALLHFLGHQIDSSDIHPLEEKVPVIHDFPLSPSQRKLREFLKLVNFYRRFIPHAADFLHPLNHLLEGSKNGNKAVAYTYSK